MFSLNTLFFVLLFFIKSQYKILICFNRNYLSKKEENKGEFPFNGRDLDPLRILSMGILGIKLRWPFIKNRAAKIK